MMRWGTLRPVAVWVGVAGVMLALAFVPGWGAFAQSRACAVAPETFEDEPVLSRTYAALKSGGEGAIFVVGGASTLGRAAGGGEQAWPGALSRSLKDRFPAARITVANHSVSRDTAAAMLARIHRDIIPAKPSLVIWETGTTDAVRGTDSSDFGDALEQGIEALQKAGAEVALMDMQFSRRSEMIVNFNRYLVIMRGIAEANEVPLFPRHEIMRHWSEEGVFDYRVRGREPRRQLAVALYGCIGRSVADMVGRPPVMSAP